MNKKKTICLAVIGLLIIGLITSIILYLNSRTYKLKILGKDFYENYYYKGLSDESREVILESLSESGVHITLNYLTDYDESYKDTFKKCNRNSTKVIVYPKKNYKKTDYTIKTVLKCK